MCALSAGIVAAPPPQRLQRSGARSSASAAGASTATRPEASRRAMTSSRVRKKALVKLFQCFWVSVVRGWGGLGGGRLEF
jgi:hypothetical protein